VSDVNATMAGSPVPARGDNSSASEGGLQPQEELIAFSLRFAVRWELARPWCRVVVCTKKNRRNRESQSVG